MPRVVVNGFYLHLPATVVVDPNCTRSTISLHYALLHCVPQNVFRGAAGVTTCTAQGPFSVPTAHGWYQCVFPLLVRSCGPFDLVLGTDWLTAVQPVVTNEGLEDPTPEMVHNLASDHRWEIHSLERCGVGFASSSTVLSFPTEQGSDLAHCLPHPDPGIGSSTVPHGPVNNLLSTSSVEDTVSIAGPSSPLPSCIQYATRALCPPVATMRLFNIAGSEQYVRTVSVSHGVSCTSIKRTRLLLAIHLLSGECVSNVCSTSSFNNGGCCELVGEYTSRSAFVHDICTGLLQVGAEKLELLLTDLFRVLHVRKYRAQMPDESHAQFALQFLARECDLRRTECHVSDPPTDIDVVCNMTDAELQTFANCHGLLTSDRENVNNLLHNACTHLLQGECASRTNMGCLEVQSRLTSRDNSRQADSASTSALVMKLALLTRDVPKMSLPSLRRSHEEFSLPYSLGDSHGRLRQNLRQHIVRLQKGKKCNDVLRWRRSNAYRSTEESAHHEPQPWPSTPLSASSKDNLVTSFREETSSAALASFTCFCCGEECATRDIHELQLPSAISVRLFQCPTGLPPSLRLPLSTLPSIAEGDLPMDAIVDPAGLHRIEGNLCGKTCLGCANELGKNKLPAMALANHTYVGAIPPELRDLTIIEEALIALSRAKLTIVQLNEHRMHGSTGGLQNTQRGMKGHVITFPQDATRVAAILPPTVEETTTSICVIFVGSQPPTAEWLSKHAKPLIVRRERIRAALRWLGVNNPLYANVVISERRIEELPLEGVLSMHIETIVDKVVMLTESMRQTGPGNVRFNELLSRLRTGQCSFDDYSLLCGRVLQNVNPSQRDNSWDDAPVIVSDNSSKDALNAYAVACFARRTGRDLHWYYATDRHKGSTIDDPSVLQSLQSLHSGQSNQRLTRIPVVLGMRVIVSHNFDVNGGVVNGSVGTLTSVRYKTDASGRRHLLSCVLKVDDADTESMPGLNDRQVPVLQDSVSFDITHPFTRISCPIHRTQLPIQPAYAITAHRAQGQTLEKVVVDLAGCSGTQSPYVMISRATSLNGLLILRPFGPEKIMCHQSQDLRKEMDRLQWLSLTTTIEEGSEEERAEALSKLNKLSSKRPAVRDDADNLPSAKRIKT